VWCREKGYRRRRRRKRRRRKKRQRGRRAHGRIDDAITDGEQVEGREDAALHGVDDVPRFGLQLMNKEEQP